MTDVARSLWQPEDWQPNDYQRTLLTRLGDSDPAEVQAATPGLIRALMAEAGDDLRTRPAEREWSVFQCVGHIADAELVIAGRYRWILAHDHPEIVPYDQDLWADRFHGQQDEDIELLLATFDALRRADIDLWSRSTASDRARYGMHLERGRESYELTFRLTAGHDLVHMDQARNALAHVRER